MTTHLMASGYAPPYKAQTQCGLVVSTLGNQ